MIHYIVATLFLITLSFSATYPFTPEQKAWLSKKHTVRARVIDYPPYQFLENPVKGLSVDYLKYIAGNAGFKIEFVTNTLPWREALTDITGAKRHYDLILSMTKSTENEKLLNVTENYISDPWVLLVKSNVNAISNIENLEGKTVAILRSYKETPAILLRYPKIKWLLMDDSTKALQLTFEAKVSAYIGTYDATLYYLSVAKYSSELKIAATVPFPVHQQAMGVRRDWKELSEIINMVFSTIPPKDLSEIKGRYLIEPVKAEVKTSPKRITKEKGEKKETKQILIILLLISCFVSITTTTLLIRKMKKNRIVHKDEADYVKNEEKVELSKFEEITKNSEREMALEKEKSLEIVKKFEELKQSKLIFQLFFQKLPVPAAILTTEGNIADTNSSFENLFGLDEKSKGKFLTNYSLSSDEKLIPHGSETFLKNLLKGETFKVPSLEYDLKQFLKNYKATTLVAQKVWIESTLFPIKNESGEVSHIIHLYQNVTQQKENEIKANERFALFEKELKDKTATVDKLGDELSNMQQLVAKNKENLERFNTIGAPLSELFESIASVENEIKALEKDQEKDKASHHYDLAYSFEILQRFQERLQKSYPKVLIGSEKTKAVMTSLFE